MDIRTRILEATIRVFGETGYRGATTRRIAQVADVNEVTLFRHFGSKEELLKSALLYIDTQEDPAPLPENPVNPERELTDWARAQHDHLTRLGPVIRTCMGESEEHPEMAQCAQLRPARVTDELQAYLNTLSRRGMAEKNLDVGSATVLLMGALFHDALGRAVMPELFCHSAEDAPARYVKLFLRAIGAASTPSNQARSA